MAAVLARYSASALYESICGQESWAETFCEPEESVEDSFYDEELFELMFDDTEEVNEARTEPTKRPFVPSCSSFANEGECSICFCEFDSVVIEFDCKHRFCNNCVRSYLQTKINAAPRLHHKVCDVSRDGIAVVVKVFEIVGVKCPHFGCIKVIDDKKIRKLVDSGTWSKFDQFALDESVDEMNHKGELHPCPLGCGYFTQEDCLCVNADCRKRQLAERLREQARTERMEREGMFKVNELGSKNPDLFRLCPQCYVLVEKNGGCDHMFCSRCNKPFLWSKALPFASKQNWRWQAWQAKHSKALKGF